MSASLELKAVLVGVLVTMGARGSSGATACCAGGAPVVRGGRCGDSPPAPRIALNCSHGYMLLRDVLLDGDKLYTQDTPDFLFSQDPNEYCVGVMARNASAPELGRQPVAVLCYDTAPAPESGPDMELSGALTLLSAVFLLATAALYCYLPQLRDVQGRCYVCLCGSMALGFLALGSLQLSPGFQGAACVFTGFSIYFWMMATFFWMNVICTNMYFTTVGGAKRRDPGLLFLVYCCWAWGGPLALLLVALATNYAEGGHRRPGIGGAQCWFRGRTETWLFFYGPVAALLSANVALFSASACALWRTAHKRDQHLGRVAQLKHRFLLCLKLFLVMGISWVFEIASFAHGESHIVWTIMDVFNCLQGVVIFVLLVATRRRALTGLARAGCLPRRLAAAALRLSPADDSAEPVLDPADADPLPADAAPLPAEAELAAKLKSALPPPSAAALY